MKENEGILKIKTEVKDNCVNYDYFGFCTVEDCIKCENASYRFIFSNGRQTGDNEYYKNGNSEEKYLIEFFDKVPTRVELEKYFLNPNSNYKITRLNDGVVLRPSKEEVNALMNYYNENKIKQEEDYINYTERVRVAKLSKTKPNK